jgi:uncharacterized SAM-binding protein YcdF (DUF218 family)
MANVFDCFGHWNVPPSTEEELANADVVATHEFGDQKVPSLSTTRIVERGAYYVRIYSKPMICQFPGNRVAEKYKVKPVAVIEKHLLKPPPKNYLDTEEVNRQIAEICKQHGWKKVILVAHPHHLWRAAENLKRHGLIPVIPVNRDIPYDPTMKRGALRGPLRFVPREIAAREVYLFKGYI